MKTIYNLIYFFSAVRRCLLPVAFLVINIIIVWVILTTSQAEDLIVQINDEHSSGRLFFDWGIILYTFLWLIFSFSSSNFALRYSTIYSITTHERTVYFVEMMLQYISSFIVLLQFVLLLNVYSTYKTYWLFFETLVIGLVVVLFVLLIQIRKALPRIKPEKENFKEFLSLKWFKRILDEKGRFIQIMMVVLVFGSIIFIIACLLLLIFGVSWSYLFNPLSIILIAAGFWIFPALLLSLLAGRFRFPAYSLFVIYVWVISNWNNNHEIVQFENDEAEKRPTDAAYIENWLSRLIEDEHKISKDSTKAIPIYIFAGEGGGIRAAYWSANLLAKLDSMDKRIYNRTLAYTGVSGSSIGFLFYQSMKQQKIDNIQPKMKSLVQKDFLTPLMVGFFFADMWQRFIPFKIPKADRAKYLENSFGYFYNLVTEKNLSDVKFLESYKNENNDFRSPMLFFNTTEAETGRKALISNVKLSQQYFYDVVDVFKTSNKDMSIISAATNSARFPIVTPAGVVFENDSVSSSLVDGGYFENTGLHTAYQLLKTIQNEVSAELREKVIINVIFLKNGTTEIKNTKLGRKYEWSPFFAFFNAWDRKSVPIEYDSRAIIPDSYYVPFRANFLTFALNRENGNKSIPLGWKLSASSANKIEKSINDSLQVFSGRLK